ncbi:TetR/AcrR family transcriptional regulator [Ilumatobacter nonamiensis]|uniref:TetR/AcrR family transcriptional regulator n=1 Tax=Ilumatobacter nonamiensis TaxID=467093 RepID=UPI000348DDDE|nr:TetR/AcrR family transcriptional regulator [Ilumatobacter nonamiensis]
MTRPAPKQQRSQATVERILGTANTLFAAHGSAGTTTTQIAEAAGVSVGALYRFFPDKHAIGEALADRYLEVAAGRFGGVIDGVSALDEVPDALREIVAIAAGLALDHAGYYRLATELRPDQAGSVGFGVRSAMVDTFEGLLIGLGDEQDATVRRAGITLAIETVRHTLATCPTTEPARSIVISELAEMVVLYAERRLMTGEPPENAETGT